MRKLFLGEHKSCKEIEGVPKEFLCDPRIRNTYARLRDVLKWNPYHKKIRIEDHGCSFLDVWRKLVPTRCKQDTERALTFEKLMQFKLTLQVFNFSSDISSSNREFKLARWHRWQLFNIAKTYKKKFGLLKDYIGPREDPESNINDKEGMMYKIDRGHWVARHQQ